MSTSENSGLYQSCPSAGSFSGLFELALKLLAANGCHKLATKSSLLPAGAAYKFAVPASVSRLYAV